MPIPARKQNVANSIDGLTRKQAAFVIAYLATGGSSHREAARAAGYTGADQSLDNAAYLNLRNPKVLQAMREEADKRLQSGLILGASTLMELAKHSDTDATRLKAATELLNRGGLALAIKHEHVVRDERSPKELEDVLVAFANKMGVEPQKLLGYDPSVPAEDAEYTEADLELEALLGDTSE